MIQDADNKVFLIRNHLRVHHNKPIMAWGEVRKETIVCSVCAVAVSTSTRNNGSTSS